MVFLNKGMEKSLLKVEPINLREFSDKNGYVDDKPYGGGGWNDSASTTFNKCY